MNEEIEALKRILLRERKARKASEKILEQKSLELFQANEKLKEHNSSLEIRYEAIIEQANDIIYRGDKMGYCTFVNAIAKRILGFSPKELIGKHFTELVAPEDKIGVVLFYKEQFLQRIENTYYEFRVTTKSGKIKWLGQNVALMFKDNDIVGISSVARDITLQKQAEEEVRLNEEKYRAIIENMRLGLLEVDLNGRVISSNSRFKELTGYDDSDILGQDPSLLLIEDTTRSLLMDKLSERKQGKSSVYEVKAIKKNGETFWMLVSGAPRFDQEGNVIGSIGIHMDISEQKRLLNQLEEARKLAEESSKAKETFLAHMSHEIRTPLNSVLGMTHLLQDTNPTKEQKDYLETIKYSSEILLSIVSDILDISKIEAGEAEFHESSFDLKEVLSAQQKAFAFKMAEKEVQVLLKWDPSITTKLIGDKTFINQILMNLMGNASKFTEKGNIALEVKKGKEQDDYVFIELKVSDTGIGISKKGLEKIFESFKQANKNTKLHYGGTGLGLSIAKHLVELHGGKISVESKVGQGTCFTIVIPFKKTFEELPSQHHKEEKKKTIPKLLKGLNLLIAEDSPLNQKFLSKVLDKFQINYTICDNGALILDSLKVTHFDLILMDVHMPILNGYETTEKIRQSKAPYRNIPIIALTASALVAERKKALECGMNEHLTKPFSPEQLIELIEFILLKKPSKKPTLQLDNAYLNNLYEDDISFKHDMFKLFLKNIPEEIEKLDEANENEDHDLVYQVSHKNKPTLTMVGLNQLSLQLEKIEVLAKKKDPSYHKLVDEFISFIPEAIETIEEELNKNA